MLGVEAGRACRHAVGCHAQRGGEARAVVGGQRVGGGAVIAAADAAQRQRHRLGRDVAAAGIAAAAQGVVAGIGAGERQGGKVGRQRLACGRIFVGKGGAARHASQSVAAEDGAGIQRKSRRCQDGAAVVGLAARQPGERDGTRCDVGRGAGRCRRQRIVRRIATVEAEAGDRDRLACCRILVDKGSAGIAIAQHVARDEAAAGGARRHGG